MNQLVNLNTALTRMKNLIDEKKLSEGDYQELVDATDELSYRVTDFRRMIDDRKEEIDERRAEAEQNDD